MVLTREKLPPLGPLIELTSNKKLLGAKGIATRSKDAASRLGARKLLGKTFGRRSQSRQVTMGSNLAYLITHVAALPFVRPKLGCIRKPCAAWPLVIISPSQTS